MRILVKPPYADFLGNKLFQQHAHGSGWNEPMRRFRAEASTLGWAVDTWDIWPVETADVILLQDLPPHRRELDQIRSASPNAKLVLQVVESPLSRPHLHEPRNLDLFDVVLTYNKDLCQSHGYLHYDLPNEAPERTHWDDRPFDRRKIAVMANSNRHIGHASQRGQGLIGLPFWGPAFTGWHISVKKLLTQNHGELYSARRSLAKTADTHFPGALDVWGAGWNGEPMIWVHKFIVPPAFHSARGIYNGDKLDLLCAYRFTIAYENVENSIGYVSEKIYDALFAGTVPVYRGAVDIDDHVPCGSYVSAKDFKGDADLLRYICNCSESEWINYVQVGQEFVRGGQLRCTSTRYVERLIAGVSRAMGLAAPPATSPGTRYLSPARHI